MFAWLFETWIELPGKVLVNQIPWALFFIALAMTIVRGGAAERLFFLVFVVSAYLSHVLWALPNTPAVYLGLIGYDLMTFAGCLVVAFVFDRYWPMWLAIALGLGLIAELAFLTTGRLSNYVYWNLSAAAFEVSALAVIVGIMVEPPKRPWGWITDAIKRRPLNRLRGAAN